MSAHTPGPWKAQFTRKPSDAACVIGSKNAEGFMPWVCHIQTAHVETANANARLIAAAPELLAACEDALVFLESWKDLSGGDAYRKALAAITKATGVTE